MERRKGKEKNMAIYKAKIEIGQSEIERINKLLSLNLEEMTDEELLESGANTGDYENVFCVDFEDGSTMQYDLCSGQFNYYDDVVWSSPGRLIDVNIEPTFVLDDIEVEIDGNVYIVELVRK